MHSRFQNRAQQLPVRRVRQVTPTRAGPTGDLDEKVGVSEAAPGVGRLDHDRDQEETDGEDRIRTTGKDGRLVLTVVG